MTTLRVGFVPSAPLLVPQVAGGSARVDADLRSACLDVVSRLQADAPATIRVVASGSSAGGWGVDHTWGFEGFGVPRQPADSRARLPWPVGIGAWLLDESGWDGGRTYSAVDPTSAPFDPSGSPAVLVVGDGTARRTEKAPGHLDDRAEGYDAEIARCLRSGDLAGLGALDPVLGAELMCGGLTVWQWLADGLSGAIVAKAELLAETAPYGVGYFAASWVLDLDLG